MQCFLIFFIFIFLKFSFLNASDELINKLPVSHFLTHAQHLIDKGKSGESSEFLFSLGSKYIQQKKYMHAIACYNKILEETPTSFIGIYNSAYALRMNGNYQEALPFYECAIKMQSDYENSYFGLANIYLTLGNFEHGLPAFERGRESTTRLDKRLISKEQIQGKNILIHEEWGIGDTLQFIRYAKCLKDAGASKVLVASAPRIAALISLCPYIDHVVIFGQKTPCHIDFKVPMLSLMHIFNTRMETIPNNIPYLYADQNLITYWKEKLQDDKNFKIGINWKGTGTLPEKDFKPDLFLEIAMLPGISIYSLQKDGEKDLASIDNCPIKTFGSNFDIQHGAFMDTAAVIKHLDLIISNDTSVAHLAGGLGITTWIMLPKIADWRWFLDRTNTPWYPSMKLFRQSAQNDWQSVIENIKNELPPLIKAEK
jgi:hypothetical protein